MPKLFLNVHMIHTSMPCCQNQAYIVTVAGVPFFLFQVCRRLVTSLIVPPGVFDEIIYMQSQP